MDWQNLFVNVLKGEFLYRTDAIKDVEEYEMAKSKAAKIHSLEKIIMNDSLFVKQSTHH